MNAITCSGRAISRSVRSSSTGGLWRLRGRSIWTTKTVVVNQPEELLASLPPAQDANGSSAALFTLSRNTPPNVLSKLVEHFQGLPARAIGCLSYGAEDGSAPYGMAYALHRPPRHTLEMVVPFRSTIAGTKKIALGREVHKLEKSMGSPDFAGDGAVVPDELPEELVGLDPSSVASIIFFSDEQPQGLMKTLDHYLPDAQKLGLLASSTPFFTGRPHTLLYGKEIHSNGAAGVAICRRKAADDRAPLYLDYNGLAPLGAPLEVTVARGNIIMELGHTNATKLLLERIQHGIGAVIDKDKGFYLGILPEGKTTAELTELESVRPIIAGDPSRGALSLDTEASITPGRHVQFLHLPDVSSAGSNPGEPLPSDRSSFLSSVQGQGALAFNCEASHLLSHSALASSFASCSEHGYVVGRPKEGSWICSVKGSTGLVRL